MAYYLVKIEDGYFPQWRCETGIVIKDHVDINKIVTQDDFDTALKNGDIEKSEEMRPIFSYSKGIIVPCAERLPFPKKLKKEINRKPKNANI